MLRGQESDQISASVLRQESRIIWRNDSGETVPAFGLVEVDGWDSDTQAYTIRKPTMYADLRFLNGPVSVPDGRYGASLPASVPSMARLLGSPLVSPGSTLGPIPDSWLLGYGTRYLMLSEPDSENYLTVVEAPRQGKRLAYLLDDLECASGFFGNFPTATAQLVFSRSDGVRLNDNNAGIVTVTNDLTGMSFPAGTGMRIEYMDGLWLPYVADCPPGTGECL